MSLPLAKRDADYKGNVSAEVAYTALSDRWDMPSTYYTKELSFKGSDGTKFNAHFIAIDTVMLAGMTTGDDPTQQPPGPADATAATSQWDWIEAQLAGSTADFVFVFGHYPVISGERRPQGCGAAASMSLPDTAVSCTVPPLLRHASYHLAPPFPRSQDVRTAPR